MTGTRIVRYRVVIPTSDEVVGDVAIAITGRAEDAVILDAWMKRLCRQDLCRPSSMASPLAPVPDDEPPPTEAA